MSFETTSFNMTNIIANGIPAKISGRSAAYEPPGAAAAPFQGKGCTVAVHRQMAGREPPPAGARAPTRRPTPTPREQRSSAPGPLASALLSSDGRMPNEVRCAGLAFTSVIGSGCSRMMTHGQMGAQAPDQPVSASAAASDESVAQSTNPCNVSMSWGTGVRR